LNKIKFHPYLAYETEKIMIYKLKVTIPKNEKRRILLLQASQWFILLIWNEATAPDYKLDFHFQPKQTNQLVLIAN
jgi:hypothetical protein